MKIAGPIILLVCGVMALVGVFLPWVGSYGTSISGWEVLSEFGINNAIVVLIGSILLLVFALPAVIVSANPEGSQKVLLNLCNLASIGAVLGIGGASFFLWDVIDNDAVELLKHGFYISYVAVALGFIFGITTIITTQRAGSQITE